MNMLRRFIRDRSGSYIPMFGLLVVPLLGMVGVAIDYSRAARVKTEMQSALDQTALALSREVGVTDTQAKLNARAKELFNALSPVEAADLIGTITIVASSTTSTISVNATSQVKAEFMAVLGVKQIPVGSESVVTWGTRKIDIAMVLDNTGSMDSKSKMTELKKAANLLIDTFVPVNVAKADTIRIGVVPFTTMVRVPTSIRTSTTYFKSYTQTYDSYGRRTGVNINNSDPPSSWQGCVVDRDQSYDAQADEPKNALTRYPAALENFSSPLGSSTKTYCNTLQAVQPLSADLNLAKTTVAAMSPAGNTNVTIGVAWGMQMLLGSGPLPQSRDPVQVKDLSKVLIVLTDGDNTENRYSADGNTIDKRTALACTNAKAAGYIVYTIRLIEGDEALLKACASTAGNYYSVKTASELTNVFANIAREISDLRLAK